jgi:hypothetical protein
LTHKLTQLVICPNFWVFGTGLWISIKEKYTK